MATHTQIKTPHLNRAITHVDFSIMIRDPAVCTVYTQRYSAKYSRFSQCETIFAWTPSDLLMEISQNITRTHLIEQIKIHCCYSYQSHSDRILKRFLPLYIAENVNSIPAFMVIHTTLKNGQETTDYPRETLSFLKTHVDTILETISHRS